MSLNNGLFTSINQDWNTPKRLYKELNKEFNFDFDPCPNNPNFNGLEIEWGSSNFVNPPYSTKLQNAFVKKAVEEGKKEKELCYYSLRGLALKGFTT